MTEDELIGWRNWFNGPLFEQASGGGEGQKSFVCSSPRGHNSVTEQQQIPIYNFQIAPKVRHATENY